MTSPSASGPTPLRRESLDDPSATEENDDALIEKLRARACDPGRRFGKTDVPAGKSAAETRRAARSRRPGRRRGHTGAHLQKAWSQ